MTWYADIRFHNGFPVFVLGAKARTSNDSMSRRQQSRAGWSPDTSLPQWIFLFSELELTVHMAYNQLLIINPDTLEHKPKGCFQIGFPGFGIAC